MRVLVISAAFPPMRTGEASHAFHLSRHLADRGLDVHVLTTRGHIETPSFPFKLYPIMRNWSWSELLRFVKFVKRSSPDAILLVYIDFIYKDHPMITFAPTICRILLPSVPFVTQFENPIGIPPRQSSILSRFLRKVATHWAGVKDVDYRFGTLLRDSHRVIVLSTRHWNCLRDLYPAVHSKTVLIPPPPTMMMCTENDGASRRRGRQVLGVKESDFLIAYIGYIYPNKGLETLLRAFQIVSHQSANVRLIMVGGIISSAFPGGPSYAQDVYQLAKQLGVDGKVTWTGEYACDTDEASVYLRAADICVFPFDTGVQLNNSSFAAAAAHGLPIVTTQGAMLEEAFVHRENVVLCPPTSPEVMAAAIKTVMGEPDLRKRLRLGALKLAQEWFSWDSAINRTIETFN